MNKPEAAPADVENKFHHYTTNRIPWFVHLMWVLFWIFVAGYVLSYLLPALKVEIVNPP